MSEEKRVVPEAASCDKATIKMLHIAQQKGHETIFDRALKMKQCNIGDQGICCKVCSQGPCRLPMTKAIREGSEPDRRMGLCGATPETIVARNMVRMIAAGNASHSDHGRGVAETFRAMAYGEAKDYTIKDELKLREVAGHFGVATTVQEGDEEYPRDKWEIAKEVADLAVDEWGKQRGELTYLKRAPQ
ncbi:MAG: anaerobic carbon-monoxide dehydrogenase catalytic subunit, partial [Candidatus Adiutrix sp.]